MSVKIKIIIALLFVGGLSLLAIAPEIFLFLFIVPLIIMAGVFLKSLPILAHSSNRPPPAKFTPGGQEKRPYSSEAKKVIIERGINKEIIEKAILKGTKTKRNSSVKYKFVTDEGLHLLVITDIYGKVVNITM